MQQPLVKAGMETEETEAAPAATELEIPNPRLAEALRKTDLRIAIEASTARILTLAMTRGPVDPDPEAA